MDEYFAPCAKKRWCLSLYDTAKHCSLGVFPQAAMVSFCMANTFFSSQHSEHTNHMQILLHTSATLKFSCMLKYMHAYPCAHNILLVLTKQER